MEESSENYSIIQADIFWFSLLHELGHIYNNEFYSDYNDIDSYNKKEQEADRFAQDFFIPRDSYKFTDAGIFTSESILAFTSKLEICPSILIGRLQKDEYVGYHEYSHLKSNYEIIIANN